MSAAWTPPACQRSESSLTLISRSPLTGGPGADVDFIIFFPVADERYVVTTPLELKSGRADVSSVSRQLQQGADFAARFAPANAVCRPVLIHGKRINLRALNRAKVRFRDRHMTIRAGRCNRAGNLAQALSSA